MTVTEFLQQMVPFLAGLTEPQARQLAEASEQRPFRKGQTILFKGVSVDGLHIVAVGKVSVHIKSDAGKWVKVAEMGPGEVFGETSIIEFSMAGATIKSESDDTLIFVIPEDAFKSLLETDAGLKERTTALIAERQQRTKAASAAKKPGGPAAAAKPAEAKPPEGSKPA